LKEKNMPSIYTIGETVYDIIFQNNEPMAAKAGGSMLNTSVSLGRLGLSVSFISEFGNDHVGDTINNFLISNGVKTGLVSRYKEGKTPIALAFLNEQNDASYSFYTLYPIERLKIELPDFSSEDIVLFGAFYSLMPEVRQQLIAFVKAARDAGALIIYDPNIRRPHKKEIAALRELVYENIALADIVRGSHEDFMTMFDVGSAAEAYKITKEHGCDTLIYTRSNIEVDGFSDDDRVNIPVPPVKSISTIGAGDSFNAGLIYEILHQRINTKESVSLNEDQMNKLITTAIGFGSQVCTHLENYISPEFSSKLRG
jgi:fructokinase